MSMDEIRISGTANPTPKKRKGGATSLPKSRASKSKQRSDIGKKSATTTKKKAAKQKARTVKPAPRGGAKKPSSPRSQSYAPRSSQKASGKKSSGAKTGGRTKQGATSGAHAPTRNKPKSTPRQHIDTLEQRAKAAEAKAAKAQAEADRLRARLENLNRKIDEPVRRTRSQKDLRRRAEYDEDFAEALKESRREKREQKKKAAELEHELRSRAARKGWETRRSGKRRSDYVARTLAEREELARRKRAKKSHMDFEFVPDAVKFSVEKLKHNDLHNVIRAFKESGIKAVRFVRQVPPTPEYPTGVASTRWMNIQKSSDKTLSQLIGSMMQPGIDYVKTFYTLADEIPNLPPEIRSGVLDALKR